MQLPDHYIARYLLAPLPPEELQRLAAEDIERAKAALAAGELEAGIYALAFALLVEPTRSDWLGVLDGYLAQLEGWRDVADERGDPPFVFGLLGSIRRQRVGDTAGAIELMLSVPELVQMPHFVSDTLPVWLASDEDLARVSAEIVTQALVVVAEDEDEDELDAEARLRLRRCAELAKRLQAGGDDEVLHMIQMRLLARSGLAEQASALALERLAQAPSWHGAVAAGSALRRAGRLEDALGAFRQAVSLDPEQLNVHLDIGDVLIELERFSEARTSYEHVLEQEPEHPWALPSVDYCRQGEAHALARLQAIATAEEAHSHDDCDCGLAGALEALDEIEGMGGVDPAHAARMRAQALLGLVGQ